MTPMDTWQVGHVGWIVVSDLGTAGKGRHTTGADDDDRVDVPRTRHVGVNLAVGRIGEGFGVLLHHRLGERSFDRHPRVDSWPEISIRQLERMGLADYARADLDGDGVLSIEDLNAFLAGERPAPIKEVPSRGSTNR